MKPISDPAHERMESPAMEKREHKTGRELMPKKMRQMISRKSKGSDRGAKR